MRGVAASRKKMKKKVPLATGTQIAFGRKSPPRDHQDCLRPLVKPPMTAGSALEAFVAPLHAGCRAGYVQAGVPTGHSRRWTRSLAEGGGGDRGDLPLRR
jgi:hypothetical protein